jgi:hypothetical protein
MTSPATPSPPATPTPRRGTDELVLVGVVVLAAIGIFVTRYRVEAGFRYWLAMTPVFGIASVWAAWARALRRGEPIAPVIRTQALHWLGASGAVSLVFLLERYGRLEPGQAGSVALIVLALACFLSGVHADWRLMVVGSVLGVAVIGFAVVQKLLWIVVVPALVALALATMVYLRQSRAR